MTQSDMEFEIRHALTKISNLDASAIATDQDLEDALGLDSLGRLELIAEVEQRFDVFFDEFEAGQTRTIRGVLEIVEGCVSGTKSKASPCE